jgi:hypothetical protein
MGIPDRLPQTEEDARVTEMASKLLAVLRGELEGLRRQLHNLNLGPGYRDS